MAKLWSTRSRRQTYKPLVKLPPIPRKRLKLGSVVHGDALPLPEELGLGSEAEVQVYMVLRKHNIPFLTQVNFDGGATAEGGQRADFVLRDRRMILEVLGFFHDTPGQQLRDERKWDHRRREGWTVKTVRADSGDIERDVLDAVGKPIIAT